MKQVINIQKFKANQDILQVSAHNLREVPSRNVDKARSKENRFFVGSNNTDVLKELEDRLKDVAPFRKDANRAVNLVLSASPEFFEKATQKEVRDWENKTQKWIETTFGKQNIIYSVVHHDEKTPHFHVCLVPVHEGKLRSNYWFDGPAKLKKLHDSYAKVSKEFGISRGSKAVKSSQTELESYYKKVNASTAYEMKLDKKLDDLLDNLNNPTAFQKLTPWKMVDQIAKPLMTQLTKNLSHYRTKAKNAAEIEKELKKSKARVNDLELKFMDLGLDPNIPFMQLKDIQIIKTQPVPQLEPEIIGKKPLIKPAATSVDKRLKLG